MRVKMNLKIDDKNQQISVLILLEKMLLLKRFNILSFFYSKSTACWTVNARCFSYIFTIYVCRSCNSAKFGIIPPFFETRNETVSNVINDLFLNIPFNLKRVYEFMLQSFVYHAEYLKNVFSNDITHFKSQGTRKMTYWY
eukprot:NODE_604_length_5488_cov_0.125997.p3 type:complete len:140 gc:universal NODE_604_length_5488_cov_0.125997:4475-4056(-)